MGLSDDVDADEIDDPTTTPVRDVFASAHFETPMIDETAEVSVLGDEVWEGDESYRVAYMKFQFGAFTFSIHLEGDDARAVAHDLLEAVDDPDAE